MEDKKELTPVQHQAILAVLSGRNIDQALKEINIPRGTFYTWMRQDYFRQQYHETRKLLVDAAYRLLECSLEQAGRVLLDLLKSPDERVRRQSAKDIFEIFGRHIESEKMQERLERLEEKMLG